MNGKGELGWVRGISMWPNLLPGDILRAEPVLAGDIRAGMLVVFPGNGAGRGPFVHRVLSVRILGDRAFIATGGDHSGRDDFVSVCENHLELKRVTGVLIAGRYRKVGNMKVPELLQGRVRLINIHIRIARKLLW